MTSGIQGNYRALIYFVQLRKKRRMKDEKKNELSFEEARTKWVSEFINAMFTWVENCDSHPFPNRKFKGASFTQLSDGTASVNFLFSKEIEQQ